MCNEIWKDIPGYEGLYQVSNLGRVKSLQREVCNGVRCYNKKENILKPNIRLSGHYKVDLYKGLKRHAKSIHQLVAIAFLEHIPNGLSLVVDHIDNDKTNNKLENLQIITQRENASKDRNGNSKYAGVCYHIRRKKWCVGIIINGKRHHLGSFKDEKEASEVYQNKLKEIEKCIK
jgi:hypothetical protein